VATVAPVRGSPYHGASERLDAEVGRVASSKQYLGALELEISAVEPEGVPGRMPIRPGMMNPFGTVHAGAKPWFADVVATTSGARQVGRSGR
jgi:acyl-coenzyme A thioesterase PaaI-like protein